MTWVFLEAEDVWLFRDGRPFSAGEEHAARSVFPPSPLTVQGVLRSHIGALYGVPWDEYRDQSSARAQELAALIGVPPTEYSPGSLGQFAMAGPYVARYEDGRFYRYFPLPADVVASGEKTNGKVKVQTAILSPREDKVFASNWPAEGLWPAWTDVDVDDKLTRDVWLREDAFADYLRGDLTDFADYVQRILDKKDDEPDEKDELKRRCVRGSTLYKTEPRFGIAIDPQLGRTREGMLYQAAFVRPYEGVGLLVWLADGLLPQGAGFLAMGGERRGARYQTLTSEFVYADHAVWSQASGNRLKVVFLTPAYFGNGWRPEDGDWSRFFSGARPRLVAAALKRPLAIGGWDLAAQQPRAMRHYVAPGSVLYFAAEGDFQLNAWAITETPPDLPNLAAMGFGQVAVGTW